MLARATTWIHCLCCLVNSAFAQIRVLAPAEVAHQFSSTGRIEGATATFGAPFYGDKVLGRLVWSDSLKGHTHCSADDYEVPQLNMAESSNLINIFVVRRGRCSFTTKVQVAYNKGAHAVIIVDREDSTLTAKDMHEIIVADDGFGGNIRIPSVLISREEGNRLINAIKSDLSIIVELQWNIPTNHVVEMDLWMSSGSQESLAFLKDFAPRRKILNKVVQFRPHYAIFSVNSSDPSVYTDICSDNNGHFCAADPDGSGEVTGKDVLVEDVRQLCIHEITKVPRVSLDDLGKSAHLVEYAERYWAYVESFANKCTLDGTTPTDRFGVQCAERVMHEVGLDVDKVQQCMTETGDQKLEDQRENSAWSPRALRINGWRYSGMMDADLVTRAICSGFISQPDECGTLFTPRNPFKSYVGGKVSKNGARFNILLVGLAVLVGCMLGCMYLYQRSLKQHLWKAMREEVMLEIHSEMSTYINLPEGFVAES